MTHKDVLEAEKFAKMFLHYVDEYKKSREIPETGSITGSSFTGNMKHSSMLLTRALASMRKGNRI
jgi:hypothetical protein